MRLKRVDHLHGRCDFPPTVRSVGSWRGVGSPAGSQGEGCGRTVRCRREVRDREVHSLFLGFLSSSDLGYGPPFLHLHNTSVSGNSPGWLTVVLGTQAG